jgi:hypothetical protein
MRLIDMVDCADFCSLYPSGDKVFNSKCYVDDMNNKGKILAGRSN